jgi:hypothetical protein
MGAVTQLGYSTPISVHFDDKSAFCVVSMLWWWCGQNYSNQVNNESRLSICQSRSGRLIWLTRSV